MQFDFLRPKTDTFSGIFKTIFSIFFSENIEN